MYTQLQYYKQNGVSIVKNGSLTTTTQHSTLLFNKFASGQVFCWPCSQNAVSTPWGWSLEGRNM